MRIQRRLQLVTGAAMLMACSNAWCDVVLDFSSDTSAGTVSVFPWDGGDAGGFGTAGTLNAAMHYAAAQGGNFAGTGFLNSEVNVYLVDFSVDTSGTYNDAGLTLFVMWGVGAGIGGGVGSFQAEVDISPSIDQGDDGIFTSGLSEIYALGPGVTIEVGGLTVDVDVEHDDPPVGYAITNLHDFPSGRVNEQWTLMGGIRTLGLYGFGEGKVWDGVDDNGNSTIFTDGLVIIIPGPGAGAILLTAFAAAGFVPRRRREA
jgi:hypothetical protein